MESVCMLRLGLCSLMKSISKFFPWHFLRERLSCLKSIFALWKFRKTHHFTFYFVVFLFSQGKVVFYDYLDSSAVSSDSPNWQEYLIKPHFLVWLRDHSTHWRATCRYNTDGTVYTDYLRASFEDFDIVRVTRIFASSCEKYELINIRGNECANCTAGTWYLKAAFPLHIDSEYDLGCDFDGNQSGDVVGSEDNFGYYQAVNSKFRCTSSSEATTQFWFGSKWLTSLPHVREVYFLFFFLSTNKHGMIKLSRTLIEWRSQILFLSNVTRPYLTFPFSFSLQVVRLSHNNKLKWKVLTWKWFTHLIILDTLKLAVLIWKIRVVGIDGRFTRSFLCSFACC